MPRVIACISHELPQSRRRAHAGHMHLVTQCCYHNLEASKTAYLDPTDQGTCWALCFQPWRRRQGFQLLQDVRLQCSDLLGSPPAAICCRGLLLGCKPHLSLHCFRRLCKALSRRLACDRGQPSEADTSLPIDGAQRRAHLCQQGSNRCCKQAASWAHATAADQVAYCTGVPASCLAA